jgi:ankyrin repeat protein
MIPMRTEELITAVRTGDAAAVSALLDEDRGLLRAKSGDVSAILLALYHGKSEIARLFVDRGAELTLPEACATGDATRVRALLDADRSLVNTFSDDGFPLLGLAIFFRQPEIAHDLIERGADVNAAARNGQRVAPVHSAAAVGDRAMMRVLLERGANPNARQDRGFVALHSAAMHGDEEMARSLVEHGADPNIASDDGKTAAMFAEEKGHQALAGWLRSL